jgi:hypothetical protein
MTVAAIRSLRPALDKQEPLTWLPLKDGQRWSASFVCSNGHDGTLLDHAIAPDGAVHPSVVCNGIPGGEGCTFHDYVVLQGWTA